MSDETVMPRDPQVVALTAALAAPFEPREVKFKPQMVKNNRCLAMAYIDARLIQDRLDDVLGVENWEDGYKILADGSVMCRLRLKIGDRWITKTDVGSPSEQPDLGDRLKAAFSDALKRAAVKFGIGRYLYRLPAAWVDYDGVKKQIVSPPPMPAWALPKLKAQPAKAAAMQHAGVIDRRDECEQRPLPGSFLRVTRGSGRPQRGQRYREGRREGKGDRHRQTGDDLVGSQPLDDRRGRFHPTKVTAPRRCPPPARSDFTCVPTP